MIILCVFLHIAAMTWQVVCTLCFAGEQLDNIITTRSLFVAHPILGWMHWLGKQEMTSFGGNHH